MPGTGRKMTAHARSAYGAVIAVSVVEPGPPMFLLNNQLESEARVGIEPTRTFGTLYGERATCAP